MSKHESKHWNYGHAGIIHKDMTIIAFVVRGGSTNDIAVNDANGRLIALSPSMYDALEYLSNAKTHGLTIDDVETLARKTIESLSE